MLLSRDIDSLKNENFSNCHSGGHRSYHLQFSSTDILPLLNIYRSGYWFVLTTSDEGQLVNFLVIITVLLGARLFNPDIN